MLEQDRIIKINIEEEMKSSYIDYSMSVIVARALPDVRDGFKPVHRRILYGMIELGNTSDKAYKKSARIVGEVLGKYHPHGDFSVYGALVRMAQDWAMRYPLVDGQGNFGSVDGDSPAAMRYTEARLKKIGEEMMQDLYKETVDFQNNFDDTLQEPTVMPTRIPNLLVNGASGIAVGMATNMPTHNLSEVIDACIAYIDNNDIDIEGLMQYVKAPDFPTGGYIYGISGVRDAYETGRGRVVMRAKAEIETHTTHDKIIVNEIPYNVNKKELIENIASLVNDKKIDGISYVNDESDREGMRIVIDVKRDANASVVLNKLFKMTALQTSFGVNNIALVHGRPKMLNLKDLIRYFVEHRHDVVIRRTQYDLRKAQERAHILEGLIIASDNIDEVIRIIRAAKTPNDAIAGLIERFNLSEIQARAIVEMRLRQLTGLMQDQLHAEYEEVMKQIAYYEEILSNDELCKKVIKDELVEVKEKYGDARRSEIVYSSEEFNPEDFYADDQMVITISHMGYIKRTPLSEFRAQNRGGVGSKGSETRDEDFVEHIYPATMHNTMMFFTQKGKCYWLKVYEIPTWKLAGDFQKAIYDEENMKLYLPGGQADTTKLYNSLAKMYDFYLKCDEIEQAKVQSGELKKPKFRKKNADALKTLRLNLVNGGGDAYNKGDYADALKYFGLFVDVVNEPMFADDDELKADTLNALYACYATLAANMLKDNQAVIKYGNIGKNHKEEGYRALMCLAETYGQKEGGDSAKWLEVIKEGTESFPKQEYFVGNIMDYYIQKGMVDEGLAQINKLLATSETPYYLYVKGILLYEKKQYDDAVAIFNKIISNNGDLVAEAYSKIGDCYFFPAQIIVEENAKLAIDDPKYNENENKIKELYEKAKPYYEKAKELKPDNKALWGNYLLNIYWKLNRAEYDSLEKELGY